MSSPLIYLPASNAILISLSFHLPNSLNLTLLKRVLRNAPFISRGHFLWKQGWLMADCGPTDLNRKAWTCKRQSKAGFLKDRVQPRNHRCHSWPEPSHAKRPETQTPWPRHAPSVCLPYLTHTLVFLFPPQILTALLAWLHCISLIQFVSCSPVFGDTCCAPHQPLQAPRDPSCFGWPTQVSQVHHSKPRTEILAVNTAWILEVNLNLNRLPWEFSGSGLHLS